MYQNELKELGLTENQSKIYLLLLKNKSLTSSEISKKLNLHRGYTYDTLERMQEKEVVNSHKEDNKTHYNATRPDDLLNLLRLKLGYFEKITPELMQISQENDELEVEIYKGKKAFRTLISDIISNIEENDEIISIGLNEKLLITEIEPYYFKKFLNIMESKHVKEKLIIKKGGKKLKISNMYHKEISEEYIGNTMEIIYKNKIATFIPGTIHKLIITENEEIANTHKKQFNLLWSIAK